MYEEIDVRVIYLPRIGCTLHSMQRTISGYLYLSEVSEPEMCSFIVSTLNQHITKELNN